MWGDGVLAANGIVSRRTADVAVDDHDGCGGWRRYSGHGEASSGPERINAVSAQPAVLGAADLSPASGGGSDTQWPGVGAGQA